MKATVEINAGVCGLITKADATCEDGQNVCFSVESDCGKIRNLTELLGQHGPFDAFEEISPASDSELLTLASGWGEGGCAACAVPVGLFKAMQVAAGLALPADVTIKLAKE